MEERVASVNDLRDGEMKQVLVGGKKVLLCRVSGEFHALGARCPHWGGSLTKGTFHEGRVSCPLHASTFDVRSGHVLEPPSLDAVPTFAVRIDGDDVFVDRPDDAPSHVEMPMCACRPENDDRVFAIIGGGAAAAAAVEALREACYTGRIVVLSKEDRWPYDRPNLSKDFLAGTMEAKWLPLRAPRFYEEHGVERIHKRVVAFDVKTRTMLLDDGASMTADAVLIATGGTPHKLHVPGEELPNVFTLRTWDDAEAVSAAAQPATRAVVVGSSFIGMESAAALVQRGLDVTVVGPQAVPFERVLGEPVGHMLKELHEENGTRFALGRRVVRFTGETAVETVELDDGAELKTGLVVVGIGVRPVTGFVEGAHKADGGGLLVDEQLRVAPDVWAAGDVATYPEAHTGVRARVEHWRLAQQHGRAAAFSMAGSEEPFTGVPFFWTQQFSVQLNYAGYTRGWDEIIVTGDIAARDFTVFYVKGGKITAACGTQTGEMGAFVDLLRAHAVPAPDELRDKRAAGLRGLLR